MNGPVYLASPYTHDDQVVRDTRFKAACAAAAKLMLGGQCVFAPIPHSVPIEAEFPAMQGFDFWMAMDLPILARCTKLVVLTLDGWERSRGVARELEYAREHGIPIEFMEPV